MYEHFKALSKEKQETILGAAMMEFASKGFALASTNVIIATAKISKGALYHYFENKEDLFSYLCRYVFNIVVTNYYEKIPDADGDIIKRLSKASELKQKLFEEHPFIFEFIKRLTQEPPGVLCEEIMGQLREVTALGYSKVMGNLDTSLFRNDMPPEKVVDLIIWSLEGYGNRVMAKMADVKAHQIKDSGFDEELEIYLELLRRCYYKQH